MMPAEPLRESAVNIDLSPRFVQSSAIVGSPATNAITSVCTVTCPSNAAVVSGVQLFGQVSLTVGTSGVTCLVQIRQTGTAGTVVGSSGAVTVVAGNLVNVTVSGFDTAAALPGQVYIIAVTIGSGAATSTVGFTQLSALVV